MAKIPPKMFNRKHIRNLLDRYQDDPSVFATENEYLLALYGYEMWERLNALKQWTERYRLSTESIRAWFKRQIVKHKDARPNWRELEMFMHRKVLELDNHELGRREIMDIE